MLPISPPLVIVAIRVGELLQKFPFPSRFLASFSECQAVFRVGCHENVLCVHMLCALVLKYWAAGREKLLGLCP